MTGIDSYVTPKGAKRWRVRWEETPDGLTGKRRQGSKGGFTTHADAKAFLIEVRGRLASGAPAGVARERLHVYLSRWLDGITVRPTTAANYRRSLRFVSEALGSLQMSQLTPEHLDQLYRRLEREGRGDGRGLAPKTVRHVHAAIHAALQDAVERGHLPRNVASLANPPKQAASRTLISREMFWDEKQLRLFLDVAKDDDLFPLWKLLAATGMRRGEALGLRWEDVQLDLDPAFVRISRNLTEVEGRIIDSTAPKTAAGVRRITLHGSVAQVLRDHAAEDTRRRTEGLLWRDEVGAVFTGIEGRRIRPSLVSRRFTSLAKKAGVPLIGVHGLRHTAVTLLLTQHQPLHVVSRMIGHADPSITLKLYAHFIPGDDVEVAAAMAAVMGDA